MKIGILGAGQLGLSIAVMLDRSKKFDFKLTVWEFDKNVYDNLLIKREIKDKLPGLIIPESINITNNISEAIKGMDIVINAVPTQFIRSYFRLIDGHNFSEQIFVNVSKGIEVSTGLDIREMFLKEFESITDNNFVVLAGPSFASEIALNPSPTTIVASSKNISAANKIRDLFSSSLFRIYSNEDVIGVEIGGSIKNVIAVAAGIIDGLGLGDNTKAALLTRGLAEMVRFGLVMGAKRETFSGLTGIGDMILTCNSTQSRNWTVGNRIGKGEKLSDILDSMSMVAEGIETTKSAYKIAKKKNVDMPIVSMVYRVVTEDLDPKIAIAGLMERAKKVED